MSTYGEQNQAWTCKKFPTRKQNDCIAPDASNRLTAIEWIGGRFFVTAIYVFLVSDIPEGIHSRDQGQPRTSPPAHLNLTGIIHEPHCSCCIICNNWPANCCIICNDSVWAKNARAEESNQPVGKTDRLIAFFRSGIIAHTEPLQILQRFAD